MTTVTLNEDTDYVHTAVINYEPTYVVLVEAANGYDDDTFDRPEARDMLRGAVEAHYEAMGLELSDLTDDVDYGAMIEFELGY